MQLQILDTEYVKKEKNKLGAAGAGGGGFLIGMAVGGPIGAVVGGLYLPCYQLHFQTVFLFWQINSHYTQIDDISYSALSSVTHESASSSLSKEIAHHSAQCPIPLDPLCSSHEQHDTFHCY